MSVEAVKALSCGSSTECAEASGSSFSSRASTCTENGNLPQGTTSLPLPAGDPMGGMPGVRGVAQPRAAPAMAAATFASAAGACGGVKVSESRPPCKPGAVGVHGGGGAQSAAPGGARPQRAAGSVARPPRGRAPAAAAWAPTECQAPAAGCSRAPNA